MPVYSAETVQRKKEEILNELIEKSENCIMPSSCKVPALHKRAKKYFGSWENARKAANLIKRTGQEKNDKNKNVIYMAVTGDKYELPMFIEDSVKELSRKTGASENNIYSSMIF